MVTVIPLSFAILTAGRAPKTLIERHPRAPFEGPQLAIIERPGQRSKDARFYCWLRALREEIHKPEAVS